MTISPDYLGLKEVDNISSMVELKKVDHAGALSALRYVSFGQLAQSNPSAPKADTSKRWV